MGEGTYRLIHRHSRHPAIRSGVCGRHGSGSGSLGAVLGANIPAKIIRLKSELIAFGVVGLLGYVTDVGLFNLLRFAGDPGILEDRPLTAKTLSVAFAMLLTYIGNRHWTWRDRPRDRIHREVTMFVVFSLIGLAISVGCLAFSHYLLGMTSPLADNIAANVVGLVLGTTFRFWAYRTFVFPPVPQDGELAYAHR